MKTLIRGGQVCLDSTFEICDILFSGAKITRIGRNLPHDADCEIVDASGCVVIPGLIDFHVHMDDRIGAFPLSDSYYSGSQAAVLSGITTLCGFVTQDSSRRLPDCISEAVEKVNSKSFCDVAFHLTPTRFLESDWDDITELAHAGYHTFKLYTTYREAGLYQDYDSLREIMKRLFYLGARLLIHAEDQPTLDNVSEHSSDTIGPFSHTELRPPEAEIRAVERIIELARETGCQVHIVHVSTAEGAELIRNANSNTQITCETAPQYLCLNDRLLLEKNGHRYLCTPPLRSESNRARMEELALDGCFEDLHREDFSKVPNGLAGVGALFPMMYNLLAQKHSVPLPFLVKHLSTRPAQLAGIFPDKGTIRVGADADLVVLNPSGPPREIKSSYSDCFDTYLNEFTTLDFRNVFVRGNPVVINNTLANPSTPTGRSLGAFS
jgi:dihydropyrimidinase